MLSIFRTSLLIFFGFLFIVGALMFAGVIPSPLGPKTQSVRSNLTIWGTVPASQVRPMLSSFGEDYNLFYSLTYKEVSGEELRIKLLEAVADVANNSVPDLVLFPHEYLLYLSDRLVPIPAEAFSSREFKNTFAEAGEVFIGQNGIYAMPLAIDPIVLYWNRDILRSKGKMSPPSTWQDVYEMSVAITEKDSTGNIGKGLLTIAMGEEKNVNWFKDILSLIFLEVGDKIVTINSNNDLIPSLGVAGRTGSVVASNASQTIGFYTDFANPTAQHYTWTGAITPSKDAFVGEKLALYIGRASDYQTILEKNQHLNFDVAIVPQFNNAPITYASVLGMSVVRQGKNQTVAREVLKLLKERKYNEVLANSLFLAPARKDLLQKTQNDPFSETFYRSAEIGSNWLDPNPNETKEIFRLLVEDVNSRRSSASQAINDAVSNLRILLEKVNAQNREAKRND